MPGTVTEQTVEQMQAQPVLCQVARQVIQPYHAAPLPFHDGRRSTQPNPVERPDKCMVWQLCPHRLKGRPRLTRSRLASHQHKPARLHGRLQRRALISGNERWCIGASSAGIRVGRRIDPDLDRIGDLRTSRPCCTRSIGSSRPASPLSAASFAEPRFDSARRTTLAAATRTEPTVPGQSFDTAVSTAASKAAPTTSHQPLKRRHRNLYTGTAPFLAAWSYAPSGNGPHQDNPSSRTVRVTARSESTRPAHRAVCAPACVTGERCPE